MAEQNAAGWSTPYKFTGKEMDDITGLYYFGARYYDPRISLWMSVDPLAEKYPGWSAYNYTLNNPVILIDPDGCRPFPVYDKYKGEKFRVDSWFGKRHVRNNRRASRFHKGLDINFGGGRFDYGAPVLSTHDGTITVDNNLEGGEGRSIIVTAPDNSFRTKYFHLSDIKVTNGQKVSESENIGSFGSSAFGSENGTKSHLHYEIQKFNSETKSWERFDPTEGKGKSNNNVVDPQQWIKQSFEFLQEPRLLKTEMPQDNLKLNNLIFPIKKMYNYEKLY